MIVLINIVTAVVYSSRLITEDHAQKTNVAACVQLINIII